MARNDPGDRRGETKAAPGAAAPAALAAERERLAVTLRSIGDAVVATDTSARITVFNKVAEDLTGWRSEEALGRPLGEVFRILEERTRRPVADPVERVLREGVAVGLAEQAVLLSRSGAELPIEDSAAPILDAQGEVLGVVLVFRDVGKQRRAEASARRHRRALLTLTRCNEALVRAAGEQALLDSVCRAIVDAGGYRMCWVGLAEQDERKTVRAVAHAGHEDGYLATIDVVWADTERGRGPTGTAIRTGRPVIVRDVRTEPSYRIWREPALARGYASSVALPIAAEGRTIGALMIHSGEPDAFDEEETSHLVKLADDLGFGIGALRGRAEHARMTAQLVQTDRLVATGTLAAGVAHEINNPLAYLIAALDFLHREMEAAARELPAGRLDEARRALDEAREGAGRVRHIVRDLKTFSRADEERSGPVDVRSVLESSLHMAANEIRHRARLVKDYGDAPPVLANEARLGQVFLNLLVNAAQAVPEGRAGENEIAVATRTDGAGRAVVEVRDTGPGIPPEIVGRIFDPFFTTKPVGVGTGVGLTVCRNIVAALGGEISVESRPGEGTTFRVSLPAAPPTASAAREPPPPVPEGRRGRVLVVDDEPVVGNALRRLLSSEHDVVVLSSARDARQRIAGGERFDAIVCDLMMPEMTGMDLHAELSALASGQAERMVFMTGGAFTAKASQFLDDVPNARIEKPFEPAALRALVRALVR